MSIDSFLEQLAANPCRRSRKLDHLGLSFAPEVFEPTQAEFSKIRNDEQELMALYRAKSELVRADLDAIRTSKKAADVKKKQKLADEQAALLQEHQDRYDLFKAENALYSLSRFERKPTADEVASLQSAWSSEVIDEVYTAMLSFASLDKSLDELKKK